MTGIGYFQQILRVIPIEILYSILFTPLRPQPTIMTKVISRKPEVQPADLSARSRLQLSVKSKPTKRQRKQKYQDDELNKPRVPVQNPLRQTNRSLNNSRRKQIVIGNQNIVTDSNETVVTLHSDIQPGLTLVDQSELEHGNRSLLDDSKFDRLDEKDQSRLVDQSNSVVVQAGGIHIDGHSNIDSVQFGTNDLDHDGDDSNMVILCKVRFD